LEDNKITALAAQAINNANDHSAIRSGSRVVSSIIVARMDGPAKKGTARGTIKGSPSNGLSRHSLRWGKIMRMAIINRTIAPAILIDSGRNAKNWRKCF